MPFRPASDIPLGSSLVVSVWGTPKSGKTTFVVGNAEAGVSHWPLPIYYVNMDMGLAPLIPKLDDNARDFIFESPLYNTDPNLTPARAMNLLAEADNLIREATESIRVGGGTIAIDTMSGYWTLVQRAIVDGIREQREQEKGDRAKHTRLDFGAANAKFLNMVNAMRASGANVVLLHHAREVYNEKGQPTNTYLPQDSPLIERLVDIEIQLRTYKTNIDGQLVWKHDGIFGVNRFRPELRDVTIDDLDYRKLFSLTFDREPD